MNVIIDMWTDETEGAISKWFINDGANVREGDMIATVSLEKTEFEVISPTTGKITLLKKENDTVLSGETIADIS